MRMDINTWFGFHMKSQMRYLNIQCKTIFLEKKISFAQWMFIPFEIGLIHVYIFKQDINPFGGLIPTYMNTGLSSFHAQSFFSCYFCYIFITILCNMFKGYNYMCWTNCKFSLYILWMPTTFNFNTGYIGYFWGNIFFHIPAINKYSPSIGFLKLPCFTSID